MEKGAHVLFSIFFPAFFGLGMDGTMLPTSPMPS